MIQYSVSKMSVICALYEITGRFLFQRLVDWLHYMCSYRLITCGTVEEKIYRKQVFKGSLSRAIMKQGSVSAGYFSRQELKALFELENDGQASETQQQLAETHGDNESFDAKLLEHITFLESRSIYGLSNHSLLFSKDAPPLRPFDSERKQHRQRDYSRCNKQFAAEDAANKDVNVRSNTSPDDANSGKTRSPQHACKTVYGSESTDEYTSPMHDNISNVEASDHFSHGVGTDEDEDDGTGRTFDGNSTPRSFSASDAPNDAEDADHFACSAVGDVATDDVDDGRSPSFCEDFASESFTAEPCETSNAHDDPHTGGQDARDASISDGDVNTSYSAPDDDRDACNAQEMSLRMSPSGDISNKAILSNLSNSCVENVDVDARLNPHWENCTEEGANADEAIDGYANGNAGADDCSVTSMRVASAGDEGGESVDIGEDVSIPDTTSDDSSEYYDAESDESVAGEDEDASSSGHSTPLSPVDRQNQMLPIVVGGRLFASPLAFVHSPTHGGITPGQFATRYRSTPLSTPLGATASPLNFHTAKRSSVHPSQVSSPLHPMARPSRGPRTLVRTCLLYW